MRLTLPHRNHPFRVADEFGHLWAAFGLGQSLYPFLHKRLQFTGGEAVVVVGCQVYTRDWEWALPWR